MYKSLSLPMGKSEEGKNSFVIRIGSFDVKKNCYSGSIISIYLRTEYFEEDIETGAIGSSKTLFEIKTNKAQTRLCDYFHNDFLM